MKTFNERIAQLKKESKMHLKTSKTLIEKHIQADHQHTHNMISCILRDVSKYHGCETANNLIGQYEIEELYGIQPIKEQENE